MYDQQNLTPSWKQWALISDCGTIVYLPNKYQGGLTTTLTKLEQFVYYIKWNQRTSSLLPVCNTVCLICFLKFVKPMNQFLFLDLQIMEIMHSKLKLCQMEASKLLLFCFSSFLITEFGTNNLFFTNKSRGFQIVEFMVFFILWLHKPLLAEMYGMSSKF